MFKKGDRVKITNTRGCGCGCKPGDMYEVTDANDGSVTGRSEAGALHEGKFDAADLELVDRKIVPPKKSNEPKVSFAVKNWLSGLPKK